MTLNKNSQLFNPIVKIYYCKVPDFAPEVSEIVENNDGTVSVVFNPGKEWKLIYSTKESVDYKETSSETNDGKLYAQALVLNYPGDGNENQLILRNLDQVPLLIKLKYKDGTSKLMGTIDNPTFIKVNYSTSGYVTGREISFSRNCEQPAPYLSES